MLYLGRMVTLVSNAGQVGVTPSVAAALRTFEAGVRDLYGPHLVKLVLFGSRARADAKADSDIDIVVVLDHIDDRAVERNRLADIAYEAIVEHSLEIQAWPIARAEWLDPTQHRNPELVRAMKRDGLELNSIYDPRLPAQGLSQR